MTMKVDDDTMESVDQALTGYVVDSVATQEIPTASDWRLLRSVKAGSSEAFEELFSRYETRLVAYAARYVGSPDLAKDVCQEVFLKLISHPPRLMISNSLAPWLFRVTRNLAIDKRRSRKFEIHEEDADAPEPREEEDPRACLSQKHDAEMVRTLVAGLSPDLREVVYLRMYGDVAFKDIASTLQIPQGTALWRMHRALEVLRQRWKEHEDQVRRTA